MKVILAGETYSSNLGDPIIADCLEYIIKSLNPSCRISKIDISGRNSISNNNSFNNANSFKVNITNKLNSNISKQILNIITWILRKNQKLKVKWANDLHGASLLIIGGGNLIMDNALYFPLRINLLAKCARREKVPYAFHACGVSNNLTSIGKKLYARNIELAQKVSVRDVKSKNRLIDISKEFKSSFVTFDPGLMAAECYSIDVTRISNRNTIGLGVAAPKVLSTHSYNKLNYSYESLKNFWVKIATELNERNIPFQFFTNGSSLDQKFAEDIAYEVKRNFKMDCLPLVERNTNPEELVKTISEFRSIIAHRLHACIVATSLRVPVVGLSWDDKMNSFFVSLDREVNCIDEKYTLNTDLVLDTLWKVETSDLLENSLSKLNDAKQVIIDDVKFLLESNNIGIQI